MMDVLPAGALLASYTEQAPITAWPQRVVLTVVVVCVIGLATWAMARNWRKRIARQDWVALPPGPPDGFAPASTYSARYVASVATEDWLDRIAAHGLGMPGPATVALGREGVLIQRDGQPDLFLPAAIIVEAASARGIAQEVYERDGIVAVSWATGGRTVTTGLRMATPQDHVDLLASLAQLIGKAEV